MSSERAPTLAEVIRLHVFGWGDEVHTALPCVVTAYDEGMQKVSVKPLIKHAYLDEEQIRQLESLSVSSNVPVQFLSAGGFTFSVPISDGSTVVDGEVASATMGILLVSEASLDRWLSGTGAEVDPEIDHRFDLTDGFFLPGVNPFGAPLPGIPADHAFAGFAGGVGIHFRRQTITVGDEAGSDFIALAQKVLTELTAIKTAFSGHTHGVGTYAAAPSTGVITGASGAAPTYNPGSVAATQGKAK